MCVNNGTCLSGANTYRCVCPCGWGGEFCQNPDQTCTTAATNTPAGSVQFINSTDSLSSVITTGKNSPIELAEQTSSGKDRTFCANSHNWTSLNWWRSRCSLKIIKSVATLCFRKTRMSRNSNEQKYKWQIYRQQYKRPLKAVYRLVGRFRHIYEEHHHNSRVYGGRDFRSTLAPPTHHPIGRLLQASTCQTASKCRRQERSCSDW